MILVYTKLIKNEWVCFATFDNYDYSYASETEQEAKDKMKERLKKSDLLEHARFVPDQVQDVPQQTKPSKP